jgi:hypothetical protein
MIKKCIYDNDICFFIEHWLNTQEKYLFEDICKGDYHIVYHSDYDNQDGRQRGRPHGGLCWVISKRCVLTSQVVFNKNVSKVSIEYNNNELDLYGVWLPFDDKSKERLCLFRSNISLIEAQLKLNKSGEAIVMGDFNSDLNRGNRFDKLLNIFTKKLKLCDITDSPDLDHTYKKGDYSAKIDHIFVKCYSSMETKGKVIFDSLDTSDHRMVQGIIQFKSQKNWSAPI